MSRAKVEPSATASSDMLRIIRGAAAGLGLELDRIYSGSGIDSELLDRPFARLPIHLARRVWTQTAAESGEPALGLRLASQMNVGALGVLDELLVTSPTLEEAFRRLGRFAGLLADAGEMRLILTGNRARFIHVARDGVPFIAQMSLALVVRRIRDISDARWAPRAVAFAHGAPGRRSDFEDWFQAPVDFSRPIDEIVFDRELLDARPEVPALARHPELWDAAERAVGSLEGDASGFGELYTATAAAVAAGNANLDGIADALGTSVRTLQRRLSELGTGHRELVEHLRAQFAIDQLQRARVPQRRIGEDLGYATPASFHRALRRWDRKRGPAAR